VGGPFVILFRLCVLLMAFAVCGRAAADEVKPDEAPLSDWAVGILAADWRDSNGKTIDAFENARQSLGEGFAKAGFAPENIVNLTLRPSRGSRSGLDSEDAFAEFGMQADTARAGCLFYFTSHGNTDGLVLGTEGFLSPEKLNGLVTAWCGARPTVVVVSACYSGVFLPALQADNRMIMTAARPDRTSFGCGEGDTYPYFDGCVVESLPDADDFVHLASLTRRCVATREYQTGSYPASEPLTDIGEDVEDLFVYLNFERPTG
jgi:hypothetical protein